MAKRKDAKTKKAEKEFKKQINESVYFNMAMNKPSDKIKEEFYRPVYGTKKRKEGKNYEVDDQRYDPYLFGYSSDHNYHYVQYRTYSFID